MLDVYATVDDLIDRFGEAEMIGLTDPDNTAVQSDRAQRKLDDAHALANGYVGMAYRLPLRLRNARVIAHHEGHGLPRNTRKNCNVHLSWARSHEFPLNNSINHIETPVG